MGDGTTASPLVLAFDVGLTNVKSVLFTADGRIEDRESVAYPTSRPGPDRVEQDPEDWWAAVVVGCAGLWARNRQASARVVAIGVTAHMHALVCLGPDGRSLGPSLVLGDRRAARQADAVTTLLGAGEIHAITGAEMDASMPAAKLAWLRENEPARFEAALSFLAPKDWLRHRLTGDVLTDPIDACATSLYDIRSGTWSRELCAAVGVDPRRLPDVCPPDSIAGHLGREAAEALGLPVGVPVVVGGGDDVEVLGNGLLGPGQSLEHLGTTGSILTVTDAPAYDPELRVELYPHAIPGLWVLGGSMTAAGAAIGAARELLGMSAEESRAALVRAAQPAADSPLFLPNLAGERCPDRSPNASGAWLSLTFGTSREALMAAAYRGVAYGLRRILDRIEWLVGPQRQITVSSGYDTDDAWLALRADVYERPLAILETPEPTALGAMAIAAAGVGLHPDVASAVRASVRTVGTVQPNRDGLDALRADYDRYRRYTAALRPAWDDEARARSAER